VVEAGGSTRRARERPPLVDVPTLAIVVLGGAVPLVRFLSGNAHRLVGIGLVIGDLLAWLALFLAAFVGVRLLTRDTPPLPIACGFVAFNLAFWNFSRFFPIQPETEARRWMAIVVWAIVTALLVRLAMLLGRLRYTQVFLLVFLGVWTVSLVLTTASVRSEIGSGDRPELAQPLDITIGPERPNVYWLMFDQHPRSDQLLERTGSDNSWFDHDLAARGFSVSTSSTSAYLQTHLSLTSTLGMSYPWTEGHDYPSEYSLASPIVEGANPVVATFEANGYRYVGAPDGRMEWAQCPTEAADRSCIPPIQDALSLSEPHSYVLWGTPVGSLSFPTVHNSLASVEAGIDELRTSDQPFFLYAHLLTPHFPYRYEADCSPTATLDDGNHLTREEHAARTATEVQCLDRDIVPMVDRIIEDDPTAVIIIQSDHGSDIDFEWGTPYDEMTGDQLRERLAALNAIRLPERCRGDSIEGEPLVNTFPIVFACLSGTEPELLEPRHWFTEFADLRTIRELDTERDDAVTASPPRT
jgi:hypothetical protein